MKSKLFILACILLLSGCQLAKQPTNDDQPTIVEKDKLIGYVIMPNALDIDSDETFYATCALDDKGNNSCYFDESIGYGSIKIIIDNEDGFHTYYKEPALILDDVVNMNIKDNSTETTINSTLYIITSDDQHYLSLAPIYLDKEGKVYSRRESQIMLLENTDETTGGGMKLEYTDNITEDGVEKLTKTTITAKFEGMHRPTLTTLIYMNNASKIIKKDSYQPNAVPQEISVDNNVAYIIIETEKEDKDENTLYQRTIVNKNDNSFTTFYPYNDIVCARQITTVNW